MDQLIIPLLASLLNHINSVRKTDTDFCSSFSMNFISILMSRILFKSPKSTQWLQSNGFYFTCHEVTGEARPSTGRGRQHIESHVFVLFYTSSAFDTIWPARLSNKLLHMQDAPLVTCITTISQIGHSMWGWRTLCPKSLSTTQPQQEDRGLSTGV